MIWLLNGPCHLEKTFYSFKCQDFYKIFPGKQKSLSFLFDFNSVHWRIPARCWIWGRERMSEWVLVWFKRVMRQCRTSNSRWSPHSRSIFLDGVSLLVSDTPAVVLAYSSFDHQLQQTLQQRQNERNTQQDSIRRTATRARRSCPSSSSDWNFLHHPPLRLLTSNSLTDTSFPFFRFFLLLHPIRIPSTHTSTHPHSEKRVTGPVQHMSNVRIQETFLNSVKRRKKKLGERRKEKFRNGEISFSRNSSVIQSAFVPFLLWWFPFDSPFLKSLQHLPSTHQHPAADKTQKNLIIWTCFRLFSVRTTRTIFREPHSYLHIITLTSIEARPQLLCLWTLVLCTHCLDNNEVNHLSSADCLPYNKTRSKFR